MKGRAIRKKFDRNRLNDNKRTRGSMVAGMKANIEKYWTEFFREYWEWLIAHAMRDLHSRDEAEDAAQRVIIKVHRAMPNFQYDPERGSFRSWMLKILDNEIFDLWRKMQRKPTVPLEDWQPDDSRRTEVIARIPADPPPQWVDQAGGEHLGELMTLSLHRLQETVTEAAYQMFYCQHFEDASAEEIAKQLGRTPNGVYTSNSRTLKCFKRIFQELLTEGDGKVRKVSTRLK